MRIALTLLSVVASALLMPWLIMWFAQGNGPLDRYLAFIERTLRKLRK